MKVSATLLLGLVLGGCCMLAAADEATWANANCDCTRERAIVCGDDGTSYLNKCWAECSGAKVAHDGACHKLVGDECADECPEEWNDPVCAFDPETRTFHEYRNVCLVRCAGAVIAPREACKKTELKVGDDCADKCPQDWNDPVCAVNPKTRTLQFYRNLCVARCVGAQILPKDLCKKAELTAEDVAAGENIPCPCTKERAIVCGADGHSYTNACWAACAQTDVVHQGPCSRALELPPCACTTERAIVCGADGHSYTNACWASCSGTSVAHDGACKKATQPIVNEGCDCHGWASSICGADGKLYGSKCTLECAGVKEGGECETCVTPKIFAPTCGKDGLTYVNRWELKCTGVEKDHDGPCKGDATDDMLTSTECQKACAPVFESVCGMNNKSYANKCRMECDGVELKHEGRCPINPASNEIAVANESTLPTVDAGCDCHGGATIICGADGKNYGNLCTLECAGVEEGSGCKPCVAPRAFLPICGKDGLTYANSWMLQCTDVEKDHDGICEDPDVTDDMLTSTECQKACPPVFEPVCGMNNKSYANKCRMECDGVELKHEGRCRVQTI